MPDLSALAKIVPAIVVVLILAAVILPQAIRILREYERGVIFRLGKLLDAKGPGLILLIPVVDRMVKMDLRVVTVNVPAQEVMTRDNVPATVDAVIYFRVVDPAAAVVKVEDFWKATSLIAQTTLRSVLGQAALDDLLAQRDVINQKLQEIIDRQTEAWGIKVTAVEVKDVALPDSMKRAMAKQAEAERERRAKIVNAEGEFQAAEKMVQAAALISKEPIALQLRYLQTMREISSEHNTTTFLPVPIDLFTPFLKGGAKPYACASFGRQHAGRIQTMKVKIFEIVLHKLPSGKSPATALEEQLNEFPFATPGPPLVTTHMSTLVSPAEPNAMPRSEESSIIIFCTLFYTD